MVELQLEETILLQYDRERNIHYFIEVNTKFTRHGSRRAGELMMLVCSRNSCEEGGSYG